MKKHATQEHYDKVVKQASKQSTAPLTNGAGAKPTIGKAKMEDDGDGSELSQTSDIEPMVEDDDDGDMGEEMKENA